MPKISVNTKDDIFEPITIEIDGKMFPLRFAEFGYDCLLKMEEMDERSSMGSLTVPYDRLEYLIGKQKVIRTLTVSQVQKINRWILEQIYNPVEKSKNLKRPGKKD